MGALTKFPKTIARTLALVVCGAAFAACSSEPSSSANGADTSGATAAAGSVAQPAPAGGSADAAGTAAQAAGAGGTAMMTAAAGASGAAGTAGEPTVAGPGGRGEAGTAMIPAMGGGGASAAGASAVGDGSAGAPADQAAMPSSGCGRADIPANGKQAIDVGGMQREYIVSAPDAYDADEPHRLIFAWHGLGGTAMQIASSFYGLASRAGGSAIFIAAQGLPGTGQQSGLASWSNTGDRDIAFTRAMLEWAKASYCIDTERVFSIGMSNGGLMSNLVGCELGDTFRAIVAMSGGGPEGYAMKPCTGQVAAWLSHGTSDNNVPFSYGEASRDHWLKTNHCTDTSTPTTPDPCVAYQGCDPDLPVHFCQFDGGHMVPTFAAEAAWTFFAQF